MKTHPLFALDGLPRADRANRTTPATGIDLSNPAPAFKSDRADTTDTCLEK